jgi:hypothetical protein
MLLLLNRLQELGLQLLVLLSLMGLLQLLLHELL